MIKQALLLFAFVIYSYTNLFAQLSVVDEKVLCEFNFEKQTYQIKSAYIANKGQYSINHEAVLLIQDKSNWIKVFHSFDQLFGVEASVIKSDSDFMFLIIKSKHGVNTTFMTLFKMYQNSELFMMEIKELKPEKNLKLSSNVGFVEFDGKVAKVQYAQLGDDNRELIENIFYLEGDVLRLKSSTVIARD
jgi:hypothetical protein